MIPLLTHLPRGGGGGDRGLAHVIRLLRVTLKWLDLTLLNFVSFTFYLLATFY